MSWWQLKSILDSAREEQRQRKEALENPPIVCPIDGDILDVNPRGVRNCPAGHFRWDGGPVFVGQQ